MRLSFSKEDPITKEILLRGAFNIFDKDGKGFISATDFRRFITSFDNGLTADRVDEMIREAGIGGHVSYEGKTINRYNPLLVFLDATMFIPQSTRLRS